MARDERYQPKEENTVKVSKEEGSEAIYSVFIYGACVEKWCNSKE